MISLLDIGSVYKKDIRIIDRNFQKRITDLYSVIEERDYLGVDLTFLMPYQPEEAEKIRTKRIVYYTKNYYNLRNYYTRINYNINLQLNFLNSVGIDTKLPLSILENKWLHPGHKQKGLTPKKAIIPSGKPDLFLHSVLNISNIKYSKEFLLLRTQSEIGKNKEFEIIEHSEAGKTVKEKRLNYYKDYYKYDYIEPEEMLIVKLPDIREQFKTKTVTQKARLFDKISNTWQLLVKVSGIHYHKAGYAELENINRAAVEENDINISAQYGPIKTTISKITEFITERLLDVFIKNAKRTVQSLQKYLLLSDVTPTLLRYKKTNELNELYLLSRHLAEAKDVLAEYTVERDRKKEIFHKAFGLLSADYVRFIVKGSEIFSKAFGDIISKIFVRYPAKGSSVFSEISEEMVRYYAGYPIKSDEIHSLSKYLFLRHQTKVDKHFISDYYKRSRKESQGSKDLEISSVPPGVNLVFTEQDVNYNDTILNKIYKKIEHWHKKIDNISDIVNTVPGDSKDTTIYIKGDALSNIIHTTTTTLKQIFKRGQLIRLDNIKTAPDEMDRIKSSVVYDIKESHKAKTLLKLIKQSETRKLFETQKQFKTSDQFELLEQHEINKQFETPGLNLGLLRINRLFDFISQFDVWNLLKKEEKQFKREALDRFDTDRYVHIELGNLPILRLLQGEKQIGTEKRILDEKLLELEKLKNIAVQNAVMVEKALRKRAAIVKETGALTPIWQYAEYTEPDKVHRIIEKRVEERVKKREKDKNEEIRKRIVDFVAYKLRNITPDHQKKVEERINERNILLANVESDSQKEPGVLYILSKYQRYQPENLVATLLRQRKNEVNEYTLFQTRADIEHVLIEDGEDGRRVSRLNLLTKYLKDLQLTDRKAKVTEELSVARPTMTLRDQILHHIDGLKTSVFGKGRDIKSALANQESSRSISEKIRQKLLNEQTIERYKAEKLDVLSYADLTHRIIQYPDEGSRFTTEREDSSGIIFETEKSLPQFNVINKSSEESIDMKIAGTRTEMPDIARIADQVYKRIEDRLRVERQRRGLFR